MGFVGLQVSILGGMLTVVRGPGLSGGNESQDGK